MEKVEQNSCQYESGIDYLQVPDIVDDIDEDTSISESPTVITGQLHIETYFLNLSLTIYIVAERKAAAISGRRKKQRTASSTSLASNTFQVQFGPLDVIDWNNFDMN